MGKRKYLISLIGCDDTTYLEKELSAEEYQFLYNLSKEANANSAYGCQPKMEIELKESLD